LAQAALAFCPANEIDVIIGYADIDGELQRHAWVRVGSEHFDITYSLAGRDVESLEYFQVLAMKPDDLSPTLTEDDPSKTLQGRLLEFERSHGILAEGFQYGGSSQSGVLGRGEG